jgi:tyrosyl-tRNA synthetase
MHWHGRGREQLYVKLGFASSKTDCRKLITSGAAKVNDEKIADVNLRLTAEDLAAPIKLSIGKKKHGLVALQ